MDLTAIWRGLLHAEGNGSSDTIIHEFTLRDPAQFSADGLTGHLLRRGAAKVVGRHREGGFRTIAYAFSADEFSASEARDWIATCAPADGAAKEERMKFAMNYRSEVAADGDAAGSVSIFDVEIAAPGEWNGHLFTERDVRGMVAADEELHDLVMPPFTIEHPDGGMAYGWPSRFRWDSESRRAKADIHAVPAVLFNEIKRGHWTRLSPVILKNYTEPSTQKFYPYVIGEVGLLGAASPAMTTLQPLAKFKAITGERLTFSRDDLDLPVGGFRAYKAVGFARDDSAKGKAETQVTGGKDMKEQEDEAARAKALTDQQASLDNREKMIHRRVVDTGIRSLVRAGRLAPVRVDRVRNIAMSLDSAQVLKYTGADGKETEGTALDQYLEEQMEAPVVVPVKPAEGAGNPEAKAREATKGEGEHPEDEDPADVILNAARKLSKEENIGLGEAAVRLEMKARKTGKTEVFDAYRKRHVMLVPRGASIDKSRRTVLDPGQIRSK